MATKSDLDRVADAVSANFDLPEFGLSPRPYREWLEFHYRVCTDFVESDMKKHQVSERGNKLATDIKNYLDINLFGLEQQKLADPTILIPFDTAARLFVDRIEYSSQADLYKTVVVSFCERFIEMGTSENNAESWFERVIYFLMPTSRAKQAAEWKAHRDVLAYVKAMPTNMSVQ